jgi:DCC1-like thiol-disulfide oxidoreductase
MRQPAYLSLCFIALQSADLAQRFPGIEALTPGEQLLVIADSGEVYRGAAAWIMCLWSLRNYRWHAQKLAAPALLPFARFACELLSENRLFLSRYLLNQDAAGVARYLSASASAPTKRSVDLCRAR